MPHIEIDGRTVEVEPGTTIIEAAKRLDIYIPHFCYHPKLTIAANCRMCLVEVEKVAKAVPACATPVADGMRVYTQSRKTKSAQKGVMEFLLINHPLDCPICDQGGECDLQDLAVGYGGSHSRYYLMKRVVKDKDIGPLIETEMTRCIHCTRCVRFTQEIAGLQELGGMGRGEHTEIGTYIERSVNSELSGNVIDLCPVGALTSKPFRYTARPWELKQSASLCPHCSTGCNLTVETRGGEVMRVLPRDNEAVNEAWICDKGRFSYPGVKNEDRLLQPLIKRHGQWQTVTWEEALEAARVGLESVRQSHGAEAVGALASARASTEELYLFQKLMRGLGVANIDHRLNQADTRGDEFAPVYPALGVTLEELERVPLTLLIGANPRKQQPMTNHRLRKSVLAGNQVMAINGQRYDFNYPIFQVVPEGANQESELLAQLLRALRSDAGEAGAIQDVAAALKSDAAPLILLGNDVAMHPQAAEIEALAMEIAAACGGRLGRLAEFGNSAGAWLTGCVPHRVTGGQAAATLGKTAFEMLSSGMKAYVLLDVEPGYDAWHALQAKRNLEQADFVLSLASFRGEQFDYADVILPIATFFESSGTLINNEGRVQTFRAASKPRGEARPAWKVLRVLGNMLELDGFDQNDVAEITREWQQMLGDIDALLSPLQNSAITLSPLQVEPGKLWRIGAFPIYRTDPVVRRSEPLIQAQGLAQARLHPEQAQALGLIDGQDVVVHGEGQPISLGLVLDRAVPIGTIAIPAGFEGTRELGPLSGWVAVKGAAPAQQDL